MFAKRDAKFDDFQEVHLPSHSDKGCVKHSGQKAFGHLT